MLEAVASKNGMFSLEEGGVGRWGGGGGGDGKGKSGGGGSDKEEEREEKERGKGEKGMEENGGGREGGVKDRKQRRTKWKALSNQSDPQYFDLLQYHQDQFSNCNGGNFFLVSVHQPIHASTVEIPRPLQIFNYWSPLEGGTGTLGSYTENLVAIGLT